MKRLALIVMLSVNALLSGCAIYDVQAHGDYDAEVRMSWGVDNYYYDPFYGVYVSFGYPSSYWIDGYYYYFSGSHWMRANQWHGPWLTIAPSFVPRTVHGYRSHVHRYPDRYPRVKLRPDVRYHHYHDRHEGRDSHPKGRYRHEYGVSRQHDQRPPHDDKPMPSGHKGAKIPSNYDSRHEGHAEKQSRPPRKIRRDDQADRYEERSVHTSPAPPATAAPNKEGRTHHIHREEQKNSPRPKKIHRASEGNQRRHD